MRYQKDYYETGLWGYQQLSIIDPSTENHKWYQGVHS